MRNKGGRSSAAAAAAGGGEEHGGWRRWDGQGSRQEGDLKFPGAFLRMLGWAGPGSFTCSPGPAHIDHMAFHRIAKNKKFSIISSKPVIPNFIYVLWHCGVFWKMCHKIIMIHGKDIIEKYVSVNAK
jgi:hypothetical protein